MDNFTPDNSQLSALLTWYPANHELYLDPRHPCIKLAGECGELLDLYAKDEYKPRFSWWDCICGIPRDNHFMIEGEFDDNDGCEHKCKCIYTPKVLDELGDISYYLRILAYQKGITFEALCGEFNHTPIPLYYGRGDLLSTLSDLSLSSNILLVRHLGNISGSLRDCTFYFLAILHKLDCSLEHLLELNYRKLNTETQNGWANATTKS